MDRSKECKRCDKKRNEGEKAFWQHKKDCHGDTEGYEQWRLATKKQKLEKKREESNFPCVEENCSSTFEADYQLKQHCEKAHNIYDEEKILSVDPGSKEQVKTDAAHCKEQYEKMKENIEQTVNTHITNEAMELLIMMETLLKLIYSLTLQKPRKKTTWGGTVESFVILTRRNA